MIRTDWPNCFPTDLLVAVSSKDDGTMLDRSAVIPDEIITTRRNEFTKNAGVLYSNVVHQGIEYGDDKTYDTIVYVDANDTTTYKRSVLADALITDTPGVGLFLPVADCVATVIYDPVAKRVALLHLGRHSTLAGLLTKTLEALQQKGSNLDDVIVWFGPSVQKESYRLGYFDPIDTPEWREYVTKKADGIYIDMQGYNRAQAIATGVNPDNLYISPIDTAVNNNYFSHSQGDTAGRFAILVMRKN